MKCPVEGGYLCLRVKRVAAPTPKLILRRSRTEPTLTDDLDQTQRFKLVEGALDGSGVAPGVAGEVGLSWSRRPVCLGVLVQDYPRRDLSAGEFS